MTSARLRRAELLSHRNPIEGYCVGCDYFWPISAPDRAALAETLLSPATPA